MIVTEIPVQAVLAALYTVRATAAELTEDRDTQLFISASCI